MINFFMSIGILTFCMVGERLYKVLDMVSKGMPAQTLLTFTLYVLPVILTYTIPWAIIVSVMLLFGICLICTMCSHVCRRWVSVPEKR